MEHKFNKKGIRDRILSLFCAVSIVIGLVSGFASGKTYDAEAASFARTIEGGGTIEYDSEYQTITYKKVHDRATSNIQYYTKHFILSFKKVNYGDDLSPFNPETGAGTVPKWTDIDMGVQSAMKQAYDTGMVMFDLDFKGGKPGESWERDDVTDTNVDFCWWDDIGTKKVTTTYKFDAKKVYEFLEEYGTMKTDTLYISHIFALKWSDDFDSDDYHDGFHRHEEYWVPQKLINIGWNQGETTRDAIRSCYNVPVPLSWNATVNVIYYDENTGLTVCAEEGVASQVMHDASKDGYTVPDTPVIIKGRVVDSNGMYWATAKSTERPAMLVWSKGSSQSLDAEVEYIDINILEVAAKSAARMKAVALNKIGVGISEDDLSGIKKKDISSQDSIKKNYGKTFTYNLSTSTMSRFTNTVNIYMPVKPAGAAVYYNFYDFDSGKAIPNTEKVLAGSFKEGSLATVAFSLGDLATNWQLRDAGAFDVNAATVEEIDTYSEAKNHSSKATDGTYLSAQQTYTMKKTIENGKAYVIWIPLVKKAPKKEIWVAYYDSKNNVQVGNAHKASEAEEGAKNVVVDVSLPSGESLPDGYTFDAEGAFDISDATISTYKQYSYAKNYSAKRTGIYTYPNYTISKMDTGKDVIVWVPVSKYIDGQKVKVYVRYITVDGKTNLKETTAPDAILGTEYTYTADGSISVTKDGVTTTYMIAPPEKYGSRPPKAVYSTKSDNLSGTKYTTTNNVTALTLTRDDKDFKFTAAASGTKAVKIFIPMIESKATNVRIVYIDSNTGAQVGSMVENNDMARGDTIIPSTTLPSGYEVDLSADATYKRLAVYKEGSDGIQSNYSEAKTKLSQNKVKEISFPNADNCNCDIPITSGEKLAVKVFVPVKQRTVAGTMLAAKYYYIDSNGLYHFVAKDVIWNRESANGRYPYDSMCHAELRNTIYVGGTAYEPSYCEGMLYGGNILYGSEKAYSIDSKLTESQGLLGGAFANAYKSNDMYQLDFQTESRGEWYVAYIILTPGIVDTNLVVHYIDANDGSLIYTETDKEYLKVTNKVQTWTGIGGELTYGYYFSDKLRKVVNDDSGKQYTPVYFVDKEHVSERACHCSDTRDFFQLIMQDENNDDVPEWGFRQHLRYCTECGGIVGYESSSLSAGYGWSQPETDSGEHRTIRTFNYPYAYKTKMNVTSKSSGIYTHDVAYGSASEVKFDFFENSDGSFRFYLKSNTYLGYEQSTTDSSPDRAAGGNVMVVYIPCLPAESTGYNVRVKYITLKSDMSADQVIAEVDGGMATVGEKYTYTGATSVSKDGVTYNVLGEGEWLAYGSNKYGQAKGDTSNVKGNPASYDGGSSWTTQKVYSQEKDGTLYIPVAVGMSVTVKYVVVKSNKTIKKVIKEVNGGAAQYNAKYRYTGDVIVTDASGKEYVVVGEGEALAYGSNSYKDALNDSSNTKGHKSVFDGTDRWTSEKKYKSYENGTLYIPVKESIPVTVIYFTPVSGGGCAIVDVLTKFTESALPGIPGESYKTILRSTIVADGETYTIKTAPSPMPVTGTYPYGVVSDHKIWWDRGNGTNIRSGNTAETTIPADVDEFYILVPVEKTGPEPPEIPDPDPDKGKKVLDDTPKAVVKSDIYEVTKAIPSTEDIYTEVTAKQYLYAFNAKNYAGQKSYSVTITQDLTVVSADDPDVVISTTPLSKTVTVYRNYSYWTIDSFALYVPETGFVTNMSLADETEMEAAFPGTLPTITKKQYSGEAGHITEPTYNSSYSMTATTITEGQTYDFDTVAEAYASSMVGEISCKNDYFKFGSKVVLSDTAKDTAADAPTISNLPDATSVPDVKAKSGDYKIPGERKNIKYDSAGRVKYVLKDSVGTQDADMTLTIADINSVKVHTPVVAKLTISEDNLQYVQDVNADKTKAHAVVGRSESAGSTGYENSTNDFVLDIDFANGKHISEKGYGARADYDKYVVGYGSTVNGTAYPKGVLVMFDFDVFANVNGDADESNDVYIPKGVWNRVYPSYYVPEWAEPGTHTVKVRVVAVNAEGNAEDEQKNKNTTDTKYVAFDEAQIEISGKIYGLTLTSNTSTAPDFKDVFTLSGKIKWMYPTKYADGTYLDGFDKNMRYYYMAGIRNELGLTMKAKVSKKIKDAAGKTKTVESVENKNSKYIYPLLDGSSPALKGTGTLKSGYTWNFRLDTVGRQTANDASKLVVIPTFYWLSKDGTTREKVDLWYSDKVNGKTYNFIKAGSDLDKQNVFVDYALSDTMGIPASETADVQRIRGDKKELSKNVTVFTYGLIEMPLNLKTFSNTVYADLMKNKGTSFTYDQLLQLKQTWYFKYALPDIYHICATGTDVETYAKKNGGVTYKEDFWKKDGYLVVHFDIGAYDKTGNLVLTYTNTPQNVADGMCDMWAMEGYVNNRTDSNGNNFTFIDGDVIVCRLPGSTTPPGGGTPPGNTPPGDPNPPTNSSEDKLVNRTN